MKLLVYSILNIISCLGFYKSTKARIREATRRNLEIWRPAFAEFPLLKMLLFVGLEGEEESESAGEEKTVGAGAAPIEIGILTFV